MGISESKPEASGDADDANSAQDDGVNQTVSPRIRRSEIRKTSPTSSSPVQGRQRHLQQQQVIAVPAEGSEKLKRERSSQSSVGKEGDSQIPSVQLQGLILGMAKTGKLTLLQRFQGKDPYHHTSARRQTVDDNNTYDKEGITIPYQTTCATWDDRIELHLRIAQELSGPETSVATTTAEDSVDFYIILVHPQHSAEAVQSYLATILDSILRIRGHPPDSADSHLDHNHLADRTASPSTHLPICICILRNFLDLESAADLPNTTTATTTDNTITSPSMISLHDLEHWAGRFAHENPALQLDRLVLQVELASLCNCYGLNVLHHFIYRSYLQRKQWDTEHRLRDIQQQLKVASNDIPHMSYETFMKLVEVATTAAAAESTSNEAPPKQRRPRKPKRNQQSPIAQHDSGDEQQSDPTTTVATSVASRSSGRRRITKEGDTQQQGIQQSPQRHAEPTRQSLESFLESDDDNNAVNSGEEHDNGEEDDDESADKDDDDDDDDSFFYDDAGRRQGSSSPAVGQKKMSSTNNRKIPNSFQGKSAGPPPNRKPLPVPTAKGKVGSSTSNQEEQTAASATRDEPVSTGRKDKETISSKDLVDQISQLAMQEGWDDSDDGMERHHHVASPRNPSISGEESDESEDDGYVIGEERQGDETPGRVSSSHSKVESEDDDDFIIDQQSKGNGRFEMQKALNPARSAEGAHSDADAALSQAALEAIAEAQRVAERMLQEQDPSPSEEMIEKKHKKKTKDASGPAKKIKDKKK